MMHTESTVQMNVERSKVVVVDDDPSMNELVTDVLREMNCDIIQAYDGLEGIRSVIKNDVDLIITDINMPQIDGISLVEQLRVNHFDTPVIIMTSEGDLTTARKAIQLGVCDYLLKPFSDLAELQAATRRALEKGTARRGQDILERELVQRVKGAPQNECFDLEIISSALPYNTEIGGYKILEELGRGGMGVVYRAEVEGCSLPDLALKVILPEHIANKEMERRFLQESRVAMRLEHPHIVQTFDSGRDGNLLFLAMELVRGGSVRDYVARNGVFDEKYAITISLQLLDAIEHLWEIQLLHRDIKPDNIIIASTGEAKLTDLGLIKDYTEIDNTISDSDVIVGTPEYLAPEQVMDQGQDLDVRTDLYSLASSIYFMLSGRPPFVANDFAKLMTLKQTEDVIPVRNFNSNISGRLSGILCKMLERQVVDRFQTPDEIRKLFLKLI